LITDEVVEAVGGGGIYERIADPETGPDAVIMLVRLLTTF